MQNSPCLPSTAAFRNSVYSRIRAFFSHRQVLEVETPSLSRTVIPDCHIDLFRVCVPEGDEVTGYLQSSPELYMKRLIASGFGDIFQIARVFRAHEKGQWHNPEFTMLEWYRRDFTMQQIIDEALDLCAETIGAAPVAQKTYQQAFCEAVGIDPLSATRDDVVTYCQSRSDGHVPLPTLTDALQYAMAMYVEPTFDPAAFTCVTHFPVDQAALAIRDGSDPRVALRFEVYCRGIEIGNGWEECFDRVENEKRMHHENTRRQFLGKDTLPVDQGFLDTLGNGMPACSGIAMGVDRLVALAMNASSIQQVISFSDRDV